MRETRIGRKKSFDRTILRHNWTGNVRAELVGLPQGGPREAKPARTNPNFRRLFPGGTDECRGGLRIKHFGILVGSARNAWLCCGCNWFRAMGLFVMRLSVRALDPKGRPRGGGGRTALERDPGEDSPSLKKRPNEPNFGSRVYRSQRVTPRGMEFSSAIRWGRAGRGGPARFWILSKRGASRDD